MKSLQECLIEESKTKSKDIANYGKTWIGEWGADFCGNILSEFIKGVKSGMEQHKSDDPKFQERCINCIDKILEEVKDLIY